MAIFDIRNTLRHLEQQLEKMIRAAENSPKNHPHENLRITTVNGKTRYYKKYTDKEGRAHSNYLSHEKNLELISSLAQESYDILFLKIAYQQLDAVKRALADINEEALSEIFSSMHNERKKLITPYAPDEEIFIQNWENDHYLPGYFSKNIPEIYTEKGERVRSKSEKIIADKYNMLHIPYKYEKPLVLLDRSQPVTVRPDFTLLNRRTFRQFYHEHLGRMDDPKYMIKNVYKLKLYEKNGIIIGDQLFLTFETSKQTLDTNHLDLLIDHYLK